MELEKSSFGNHHSINWLNQDAKTGVYTWKFDVSE